MLSGSLYLRNGMVEAMDAKEIEDHGFGRRVLHHGPKQITPYGVFHEYALPLESLRSIQDFDSYKTFRPISNDTEARITQEGGLQLRVGGSRVLSEFSPEEFQQIQEYL